MSLFAKAALLAAAAGIGALVLFNKMRGPAGTAPLPNNSTLRPPPITGNSPVANTSRDIAAAATAGKAVGDFFKSLPIWGTDDGPPALGAYEAAPSYDNAALLSDPTGGASYT